MNASSIGAVMSSVANVRGESRLASASKLGRFSLSTIVSFHMAQTFLRRGRKPVVESFYSFVCDKFVKQDLFKWLVLTIEHQGDSIDALLIGY